MLPVAHAATETEAEKARTSCPPAVLAALQMTCRVRGSMSVTDRVFLDPGRRPVLGRLRGRTAARMFALLLLNEAGTCHAASHILVQDAISLCA